MGANSGGLSEKRVSCCLEREGWFLSVLTFSVRGLHRGTPAFGCNPDAAGLGAHGCRQPAGHGHGHGAGCVTCQARARRGSAVRGAPLFTTFVSALPAERGRSG